MKRLQFDHRTGVVALPVLLGCSADSPELRVLARDATTGECPQGGLVLTVQDVTIEPICDGVDGQMGARGEPGGTGAIGATGAVGAVGKDAQNVADVLALIRPKNPSVIHVECTDGTSFYDASGTKTTAGTVITAQHVVQGMTSCDLYSAAPLTLLGSMVASAQRGARDEAQLQVEWTSEGAAWESAWSTDAVSWHGNSGGPVFDADGNWIGVLVGGFNGNADQAGPDLSVVLPLF